MSHAVILCVDDEPNNLAILRLALKDHYSLIFANNGENALEVVTKHRPSLILLDVKMPGMNGYEVCRRLKSKEDTVNIPVIFVTGMTEDIDEKAGFEVGAVDYITKPISALVVLARVRTHLSLVRVEALEKSYYEAIHMLGIAGHYNDTDTGVHIWRMAAYSRLLAESIGWAKEKSRLLELAAPMHDTGKIGIPDSVLKKPGKLNQEEWKIMKMHTIIGHGILKQSQAPLFQLAAEVALGHHEKWDGSGYPYGLSAEEIPESARIVALADVFDALAMKRPYKEPWPQERIIAYFRENVGAHFEKRLVEAFLDIMPNLIKVRDEWDEREQSMAEQEQLCSVTEGTQYVH